MSTAVEVLGVILAAVGAFFAWGWPVVLVVVGVWLAWSAAQ